jgi:hypothetical protein
VLLSCGLVDLGDFRFCSGAVHRLGTVPRAAPSLHQFSIYYIYFLLLVMLLSELVRGCMDSANSDTSSSGLLPRTPASDNSEVRINAYPSLVTPGGSCGAVSIRGQSPLARSSPTTCAVSVSADSLMSSNSSNNNLESTPNLSPSVPNTSFEVPQAAPTAPAAASLDGTTIPFTVLSPKLVNKSLPQSNGHQGAIDATTGNSSVSSVSKRIAASSTLSRLQKTSAPVSNFAPRPPQPTFPAGHQLPNFEPATALNTGSYASVQRSPTKSDKSVTPSPVLTENDIRVDSNGNRFIPNGRIGDSFTRDAASRENGRYVVNRPPASLLPALNSGVIGSEYDSYRSSPLVSSVGCLSVFLCFMQLQLFMQYTDDSPVQMVHFEPENDGIVYRVTQ